MEPVGVSLGSPEGTLEGTTLPVGSFVGTADIDGAEVGWTDGSADGLADSVGDIEGRSEGASLGIMDGALLAVG